MCGRFNLSLSPTQVRYLDELGSPYPYEDNARLNITPTDMIPMLTSSSNLESTWRQARWWLTPSWSQGPDSKFAMFNARSETLHSSRAFKKSFQSQRCIIPATSYLEWKKITGGKQVFELYDAEKPILFAGIWDKWLSPNNEALFSCAIVTAPAHPAIAEIHSRMPVMLDLKDARKWLAAQSTKEELNPLFASYPITMKHREVRPDIDREFELK